MDKLLDDIYKKGAINPAEYDYSSEFPSHFTKELYVATFRKMYATLRHDFYVEIQKERQR